MRAPIVIIGAGLAGLAAGIRLARAGRHPLIIEQHDKPGGLNSYYFRQGMLLETGLHAMTNFAPPELRHAPLNRLFRQLKLSRKNFITHEQILSEIRVQGGPCLCFSNDFSLLRQQIVAAFPEATDGFQRLIQALDDYDPFTPAPWRSTRQELCALLDHEVLRNLLLWPIMLYGNASEDDMDFAQFVILFRAIFQEGLFRPADTMKDFLDLLLDRYRSLGGEIRFRTPVAGLTTRHDRIIGVELISGESLACEAVLSTAGLPATRALLGDAGQLAESIRNPGILQIPGEEPVIDQADGCDRIPDGLFHLVRCLQMLLNGGQSAVKSGELFRPFGLLPCILEGIKNILLILSDLDAGSGDNKLSVTGW